MERHPQKLVGWRSPRAWVTALRQPSPVFLLGGNRGYSLVASGLTPVVSSSVLDHPWPRQPDVECPLPFLRGHVGMLAYDDFTPGGIPGRASRFFRVREAVLFDHERKQCWAVGDQPDQLLRTWAETTPEVRPADCQPWELTPRETDDAYMESVRAVIQDIRQGRFYQLNRLRYFSARRNNMDDPALFLQDVLLRGGPMGAALLADDIGVLSYSPERFVRATPTSFGVRIEAAPIKGTAPRGAAPVDDQRIKEELLGREKDLAELHMIVDLMRHDLSGVARPLSVQVEVPHQVRTFPTLHHLEARVAAFLDENKTVGQVLGSLCPAGSITGAPKREVMQAIYEQEKRPRGFFMGNAFYLDDRGYFDSSVLIRTLQRIGGEWEYAAGSGLTIRSDPEQELAEVYTKCRVLTDLLVGDEASE